MSYIDHLGQIRKAKDTAFTRGIDTARQHRQGADKAMRQVKEDEIDADNERQRRFEKQRELAWRMKQHAEHQKLARERLAAMEAKAKAGKGMNPYQEANLKARDKKDLLKEVEATGAGWGTDPDTGVLNTPDRHSGIGSVLRAHDRDPDVNQENLISKVMSGELQRDKYGKPLSRKDFLAPKMSDQVAAGDMDALKRIEEHGLSEDLLYGKAMEGATPATARRQLTSTRHKINPVKQMKAEEDLYKAKDENEQRDAKHIYGDERFTKTEMSKEALEEVVSSRKIKRDMVNIRDNFTTMQNKFGQNWSLRNPGAKQLPKMSEMSIGQWASYFEDDPEYGFTMTENGLGLLNMIYAKSGKAVSDKERTIWERTWPGASMPVETLFASIRAFETAASTADFETVYVREILGSESLNGFRYLDKTWTPKKSNKDGMGLVKYWDQRLGQVKYRPMRVPTTNKEKREYFDAVYELSGEPGVYVLGVE